MGLFQIYSERSVYHSLEARGWAYKQLEYHAKEQDEFLRNQFRFLMRPIAEGGDFKADHLRFLGIF
jgi:hypothetical protein